MTSLVLIGGAFFTSLVTSALGIGGGVLLIAIMPGLVPVEALIPIHAATQLMGNFSRAVMDYRLLAWSIGLQFLAGCCLGVLVAAPVVQRFPVRYLPMVLGGFILLVTWAPEPKGKHRVPGKFFTLGAMQTFLGMFTGATGPISFPFLLREGLDKNGVVATSGLLTTFMQLSKVVAFMAMGFAYRSYLPLILGLAVTVVCGTWTGRKLRCRIPEAPFRRLLKYVLSILALRMIFRAWA